MAEEIRKVAYFAMDVPDKPGEGARVLGLLADAGVKRPADLAVQEKLRRPLLEPADEEHGAVHAEKVVLAQRHEQLPGSS